MKIASNQDEPVSKTVLQVMLELGWIKLDYLTFLAETAHTAPPSKNKETKPTHTSASKLKKENSKGKTLPVNNSQPQEVRARKYRRMSPSDEFIDRFGNYETSITGLSNNKTLVKYYFKRINITFFVIQENKTIIGFSDGKGFM